MLEDRKGQDAADEPTIAEPTIRMSTRGNEGIAPRRPLDEQGMLAAASANIAVADNGELAARTLREALNHPSRGKRWNDAR
jgi:hypothetical protein